MVVVVIYEEQFYMEEDFIMKKIIVFLALLFCSACTSTAATQHFKTDLNKIKVNYDKGFVYQELPKDHLMDEKMLKRTLPVKQEDAERDVNYILQTFLYENGRKNRDTVLGMNENKMIDTILPKMISVLGIDFEKIPDTFTVPVFEEEIKPKEIYALNIKSIIDAKQTSNLYELLDVEMKEDGKVVATVEKRYIDNFQYTVRMSYHKDYDKFQRLLSMGNEITDKIERAIVSAYMSNLTTYNATRDTLTVIPLNHSARTREVEIEFEYDKDGYLRLTEKGLIELIS